MQKQISLFWAKIQLKIIRFLPMLIAFIYLLNTVFSYFNISTTCLCLLGGMSFLPLIFLYVSSYAFRFCDYHRMFLHYVTASDTLNWINYINEIPLSDLSYCVLLVVLFGITCFIALFMFLQERGRLQS